MQSETKICQNCKKEFTIEPADFLFYEKIKVPPPTFCPDCRLQRRYAWRNLRCLYRRECGLCKKEKVGVFAPGKPYNSFCSPCWYSDQWNPMEYGRDYDFSKPFFTQFEELLKKVPLLSRAIYEDTMVNSDFTHMAHHLKDCYLVFHGINNERCMYCDHINQSYDCFDVSMCTAGEQCFQSVNLKNCNKVFFSQDSEQCHDSFFLRNCTDCHDCFGSINLKHKEYYIFNKPYSKEAYAEKLKEMGVFEGSFKIWKELAVQARTHQATYPVRFMHGTHNDNVTGDYVFHSKNVSRSFLVQDVEDSKYCSNIYAPGVKDCYDWTQYGDNGELMYEILQSGQNVYHNRFGWCIWRGTKETEYGIMNIGASSSFGCIGIRQKQFCILNKQYSEEEYWTLRDKIVQHMNEMPYIDKAGRIYKYGEFFPVDLSPFAYNETTAIEEFPMSQQDTAAAGFSWIDKDALRGTYAITLAAADLPDTIMQSDESVLKQVIGCQSCKKSYRIMPQEFAFYKKVVLPLPRLCPDCRYMERKQYENPMRLWPRQCMCDSVAHGHSGRCSTQFETSYAPERPEIVYCEQCYQAEVV